MDRAAWPAIVRDLQHAAALLRADADHRLWAPLANPMLYYIDGYLEARGRLDLRRGVLEAVAGSAGATFRYGGRRSILAPRARRQPEQGGRCAAPAGRSCRALDLFHASRAISQRLADADPTNAGLQRDLSISLNKVGDVLRHQGDLAGRAGRVPGVAGDQTAPGRCRPHATPSGSATWASA